MSLQASANSDPMVAVPLNISADSSSSDLKIQDFTVVVDGCLSGFEISIPKSKGETVLPLLANDRDCVAKLISLKVGGKTYAIETGDTFDPEVGAINRLINQQGDEIHVGVTDQLSPVIIPEEETVGFALLAHERGESVTVVVGEDGECKPRGGSGKCR